MSQPLAIIAKIAIGETAYKKYLRSDALKKLITSMLHCMKYESKDFYIFQYNKKVHILNVFIYYHYGNIDTLRGADFESIKAIDAFLNAECTGYLTATTDAANWNKADFSYTLDKGQWTEQKEIDTHLYAEIAIDAKKQYKKLDGSFAEKALTSRVLDSLIIKRLVAMVEKDRQDNLINRLHEASPYKPLYLFGDYYYNGVCVYTHSTPLFEIDPKTFVQTPYGGTDGRYVVIMKSVIKTDPTKFRKLQKGETEYYISEDKVWDWQLQEVPDADPKTFTLKSTELAEDAFYVYFGGIQISKNSLGQFRIEKYGPYFYRMLLIGEKSIYNGPHKLAVDAPTFKLNTILDVPRVTASVLFFWFTGQDKDGDFLCLNVNNQCSVMRNVDINERIEAYKEIQDERSQEQKLIDTIENPKFKDNFDKAPRVYLVDVNNYFYYRFQNWKKTKDKAELDKIIGVYNIVENRAWNNPSLYHHVACAYAALGNIPRAVFSIQRACAYGYEKLHLIWEDSDLKTLHSNPNYQETHERWQRLKLGHNQLLLTMEVLEKVESLPDTEVFQVFYQISKRFRIPDKPEIDTFYGHGDEIQFWDRYTRLLTRLFDLTFTSNQFDFLNYKHYKDHYLMPIWGHFGQLQYEFAHAHIAGPTFRNCEETVKRIEKQLAQLPNREEVIATMNESNVVKILGIDLRIT